MTMILGTGATSVDIVLGVLACLFVLRLITTAGRIPKGLRLPPGPRGKPIIGNVVDMPTDHEWETVIRWANEYGDLVYIKVLGIPIVFVNSLDVARDLFEKRSSLYSDRYKFPMMMLMGWDWSVALMGYGQWWRRHRKLFHRGFQPTAAVAYHPIQTKQARALLRRLHESPEDFIRHFQHLAAAVMMEIVYAIKVLPTDDRYIHIAEQALEGASQAAHPGAFLVDLIPILKYVPEWVPGAGFKRKARMWRAPTVEMNLGPFVTVKKALSAGTAEPSLTASLLEELSDDAPADEEDVIRNVGSMAYAGAADSTVSALASFIHAMVLYPEVQRKAQAELDSAIDMNRLPCFEDRESLPYINALCKEVLRWHPVTPLGLAHRLTRDDVYGDYFIPGGSIIVGNTWAILHDEKTYGPNPERFEPERFLKPGVEDPTAAFGYGRRICPGRHTADSSLFIVVASILKVFDISPAKDNKGSDIPVVDSVTSGAISRPEPFQCSIKPRSASAESLLLGQLDD